MGLGAWTGKGYDNATKTITDATSNGVRKIAELPDSGGKCVICRKGDSYLIVNMWGGQKTKWHSLPRRDVLDLLRIHFSLSQDAAEAIINR